MSSIKKKIKEYVKKDVYPFHMPGHKRKNASINKFDITEIDGFDYLHEPKEMFLESLNIAKKFYNTKETFYLVNGSTVGIIASILSVSSNFDIREDKFLVATNSHISVFNGLFLSKVKAEYIEASMDEQSGILTTIDCKKVENYFEKDPSIKALIITSPTYEGVISDIENIAKIVHKHEAILIVDEAHGAHFSVKGQKYFPDSAIEKGADLVIQSLHKTLPALTQTALLHVVSDRVDIRNIRRFVTMLQTSSPSYLLTSNIDEVISNLVEDKYNFDRYVKYLYFARKKLALNNNIKMFKPELKKGEDYDKSKIVLFGEFSGTWLKDILKSKYNIQVEMAAHNYCILMTSVYDTRKGFNRLIKAIKEIDKDMDKKTEKKTEKYFLKDNIIKTVLANKKEIKYTIYEVFSLPKKTVRIEEAEGFVSSEKVYLYPPGIPILLAGEIIDKRVVDVIKSYHENDLKVIGIISKESNIYIEVVDDK